MSALPLSSRSSKEGNRVGDFCWAQEGSYPGVPLSKAMAYAGFQSDGRTMPSDS